MDRTELELSDSPAAPANDTSVWSIGNFLAWTALSSPTSVTWWNTSAGVLTVPELEYSHDKKGPAVKACLWWDLSWNWIRGVVEEILGCLWDAGAGGLPIE